MRQLLEAVPSDRLLITDFSFHSIGVILLRLERTEALLGFAKDLFTDNSVRLLALEPGDMERLISVASDYRLDFDDAYQYVAAELNNVSLVSFDSDFDNTELGRITPLEVMMKQEKKE